MLIFTVRELFQIQELGSTGTISALSSRGVAKV
jgi:hypothetical protein